MNFESDDRAVTEISLHKQPRWLIKKFRPAESSSKHRLEIS